MIKFLKNHFVPGPHNDHQPHILRKRAVFFILGFVLIVEVLFLIQMLWVIPYTDFFSSVLSNVLVDLANTDRQDNNVFALQTSPVLEKAAKAKAEDMAQSGYFSHTSPAGKTPWEWLVEAGYSYKYAGENLAVNFFDSVDIERAWMNSASHKKNILNSNFTEIGIGTATGIYKNREAIFVVQFFGRPAKLKAAVKMEAGIAFTELTNSSVEAEGMVKGEETYIAVEDENVEPFEISATDNGKVFRTSFFKRIFVMPKTLVDFIYLFIAVVIVLALILKFLIKIKIQYPKLVFNGVLVLFVIISIIYLNTMLIGKGYVF